MSDSGPFNDSKSGQPFHKLRVPKNGILRLAQEWPLVGRLLIFGSIVLFGSYLFFLCLLIGNGVANAADLWLVGLVLGLCALGCLWVATLVDDLTVELLKRTYYRRCGCWPFHRRWRGSLTEIDFILICTEFYSVIQGHPGRPSTGKLVEGWKTSASLCWKNHALKPFYFAEVLDKQRSKLEHGHQLYADVTAVSQLTNIPITGSVPKPEC